MTHNYLNLGLEHLAGGDLNIAIEHLRDTHLQLLFRLGVSLTIDLRKRAEERSSRPRPRGRPDARDSRYLDSPFREAIAGFMQRQPRFYGGARRRGLGRDARLPLDARSASWLCDARSDRRGARRCSGRCSSSISRRPAFPRADRGSRHSAEPDSADRARTRYALDGALTIEPIEASRLDRDARRSDDLSRRDRRTKRRASELVAKTVATRLDESAAHCGRGFRQFVPERVRRRFAELDAEPNRSALYPQPADRAADKSPSKSRGSIPTPAVISSAAREIPRRPCSTPTSDAAAPRLGTPISRLASFRPPIGRLAFPG